MPTFCVLRPILRVEATVESSNNKAAKFHLVLTWVKKGDSAWRQFVQYTKYACTEAQKNFD
jgi:hypothetical protein